MKITNRHNLPETIVRAVKNDPYTRGESRKSVSQLIGSPRIDVLRSRHYAEMEQDASDMIWSLLGHGVHAALERGVTDEHVSEERLFMEVDGWTISGAIDLQQIRTDNHGRKFCKIQDYKVCQAYSAMEPKLDWERQQNVYAALVEHVKPDVTVEAVEIVAIIRDWSRRQAQTTASYPQAPIQVIKLPLWSPDERLRYIRERVAMHLEAEAHAALGMPLPECSREETWERGGSFKVIKKGAKRAKFVTQDFLKAGDYIAENPGHEIIAVPPKRVRCEGNWCGVAQFCEQWAEYRKSMGDDSDDDLG